MKHALLIWLVCSGGTTAWAQRATEVIVVGLLKTDRTFDRGEKSFFEVRAARDRVVYLYDSSRAQFVVEEYVRESGFSIENRDSTVKEKHKIRTRRFSNQVPHDLINQFVVDLTTNVDSLPVNDYSLHTSHYYLNVFVSVVIEGDTTTWHKSQPFERATPWHSEKGTFLNPAIDSFVVALLPKKFIGRDALANPRVATTNPTSMLEPTFRVSDCTGKPGGW